MCFDFTLIGGPLDGEQYEVGCGDDHEGIEPLVIGVGCERQIWYMREDVNKAGQHRYVHAHDPFALLADQHEGSAVSLDGFATDLDGVDAIVLYQTAVAGFAPLTAAEQAL